MIYRLAPCVAAVVVGCSQGGGGEFDSSTDASSGSQIPDATADGFDAGAADAAPDVASGAAHDAAPDSYTSVTTPEAGVSEDAASDSSTSGEGEAPPTPVVLPCDHLAAVGTWENITPPPVDLTKRLSQAFVLDPVHPGTVYLGLGNTSSQPSGSGVWKTTDCGASWTAIDTGAHSAELDQGMQWTMAIDFVDPQVLYTHSGYGSPGVYKSTNGGVDWTQILPPDIANVFAGGGSIERITMDPTDHRHLIVTPHFNCMNGHSNCMLETLDSGSTWRVLDGTPDSGEDSGQTMIDAKTWYWMNGTALYQTTNGGGSWTPLWSNWTMDNFYKSPTGKYYVMSGQQGVLQSSDGLSWAPIPGSPHGRAVFGDGTTLFTSNRDKMAPPGGQPYMSGSESDPTKWATYPSPNVTQGGWLLRYDEAHGILYSSAEWAGFWRVRTK
jgi:hypothetical protein